MKRRRFLGSALGASAGVLAGPELLRGQAACLPPFPEAQLLGSLPLSGLGGVEHPLGTLLGRGLDARLATDLSTLTPESLVTPNDRFFVRSEAPAGIEARRPWTIRIGGLVQKPLTVLQQPLRPGERLASGEARAERARLEASQLLQPGDPAR